MRGLVISLYAGVFIALLTLGWGIDKYYDSLVQDEQQLSHPGYREALKLVANYLSEKQPESFDAKQYLRKQSLEFTLEKLDEVALPVSLAESIGRGEIILLQSNVSVSLHIRVPDSEWMLNLELPQNIEPDHASTRFWLTLLFYLGVAAILLLWLAPLLRSIHQLTQASIKIGQGKLDTRVKNPSGLYLSPLKTEFNAMAERLQKLNQNNRLLSQAVSHELRTPLSRMRFALDLLASREDKKQRQADIGRMENDLDAMEALINELLNFARLDTEPELNYQNVEIEALIRQRIGLRYEQGKQIEFIGQQAMASIRIDPNYFSKIIDNLIQNACRHAKSKVQVSCIWSAFEFQLQVADDGSGVDVGQRKEVFKPFTRLTHTSAKASSGFGLGLAIVQQIAKWHGASVDVVDSKVLGGALFRLKLKLEPKD